MARHFKAWGGDPHAFSAVNRTIANRTGDKKGAQRTTANLRAGARMQAVCKRFSWGFALP